MQINKIYFFIILLIGLLANNLIKCDPCNRFNFRICSQKCIGKGGVKECQQICNRRGGQLTVCLCRQN